MTAATPTASSALLPGTRLGEFEITGVVGEGGFGIVYSARDLSLDRMVAIKEYLPSAFASRDAGGAVVVRSEAHASMFAAGLSSFVNEARMLAKFSHAGLVEVFRFWEANGTAYMVMRYYRGVTLREMVRTRPEVVTESWLCETLDPILLALQELHSEKCYHRDVAPDNILVLPNGRSVLMDFGAARRIIGGMTRALTTVLKPGYAPVEQYSDDGSMPQGAWTDVYAVGGLLYYAMSGKVPVQAISRMMKDPLRPVESVTTGQFSQNLCAAVMKCLAVLPENRFQSIDELRAALGWVTTPVSSTVLLARPEPVLTATAVLAPSPSPLPPPSPAPSPAAAAHSPSQLVPAAARGAAANAGAAQDEPSDGTAMPSVPPTPPITPVAPEVSAPTPLSDRTSPLTPGKAAGGLSARRDGLPLRMVAVAALAVALSGGYLLINRHAKPAAAPQSKTIDAPSARSPQMAIESAPPAAVTEQPGSTGAVNVAAGAPPPAATVAAAAPGRQSTATPTPTPSPSPTSVAAAPGSEAHAAEAAKAAATAMGRVDLRIRPWGYVVVDGGAKVSTPPTMQLKLAPGRHEIEITNPAGAPVVKTVEVIAGKAVTVQHNF